MQLMMMLRLWQMMHARKEQWAASESGLQWKIKGALEHRQQVQQQQQQLLAATNKQHPARAGWVG
jgi:hypothetical protein